MNHARHACRPRAHDRALADAGRVARSERRRWEQSGFQVRAGPPRNRSRARSRRGDDAIRDCVHGKWSPNGASTAHCVADGSLPIQRGNRSRVSVGGSGHGRCEDGPSRSWAMNAVSGAKQVTGAGPAAALVQPLRIAASAASPQTPFGLVMAKASAGGLPAQRAPKLITVPTIVRQSRPPHSDRATDVAATEARDGKSVASRRPARSSESFDCLPRRNVGSPADLAAWLSSTTPLEATTPDVAVRAAGSLEDLLPALVRRVAWSSDGKRGTARLEIGSGDLAGATLLVHADAGRVRVRLEVPPGVDAPFWRERIVHRLATRDIPIDDVEVS